MNNFCTVVLTSTRQHYGMIDIDKVSISDTYAKSSIIRDNYKFCHIKVTSHDDDKILHDKVVWFKNKGFDVVWSYGNWKNDDASHGQGIIDDMALVYGSPHISKYEYCLQLENDWTFETDKLDDCIYNCLSLLRGSPDIIYVRPTRIDQPDTIKRLAAYDIGNNYYITNREFSFNPFLSRIRDMKYISNFVSKNNIHQHCEMSYEIVAKYLNNKDNIFSFIDNKIVRHIGGREFQEEYENKIKEIK